MSRHRRSRGTGELRRSVFVTLKGVYPPSEDTFFLLSVAERFVKPGHRVLEVGTGSGYIAIELAKKGALVTATDISPSAILNARLNARLNGVRIRFLLSNLFEGVHGRFDAVIFNPPYLEPWEEVPHAAWDAEEKTLRRFFNEVGDHLLSGGRFFVVLEENDVYRKVKKWLGKYCVREHRNAFHLVVLEGYPCP